MRIFPQSQTLSLSTSTTIILTRGCIIQDKIHGALFLTVDRGEHFGYVLNFFARFPLGKRTILLTLCEQAMHWSS